ncbi:ABC transporter substrate-binding protein [Marinobacter sp.]|uniref:ABC transporter substrate-binding protein n=1 Tax=Marinobacter sp. TaxID=50741 RepID=UPI0035C77F4F
MKHLIPHRVGDRLAHCAAAALLALVGTFAQAQDRTLDTAFGSLTVTGTPERVVTLYEGALDAAIAVGVKPVGAIITRGGSSVAEYIQPRVGEIAIVGTPGETNLEAVIALQPDLILASNRTNAQQYELLSAIAPTVVPDVPAYQSDTWIRETRLFAKALGKPVQGEAAIAAVRERIDAVSLQVASQVPQDRRGASVVRWMPQGAMVMATGIFSATLLEGVGFDVNDAGLVKEGRPHSSPLSEENLSMIDQSWLFLATLNEDGREALAAAKRSPAFRRLQAVEAGQVVPVDGQVWSSATGPIAAGAILDRIEAALSGAALAKVAP